MKVYDTLSNFKKAKEEKLFHLDELLKRKMIEIKTKCDQQNNKLHSLKILKISNSKILTKNFFNEASNKFIKNFKEWFSKYQIFVKLNRVKLFRVRIIVYYILHLIQIMLDLLRK